MSRIISIDAVEINSLVAARPRRILVVLEREPLNGLWQLTLSDPDRRKEWRLGHYIDGYESREVELQDELKEEKWPRVSWPEMAWTGDRTVIYVNPGDEVIYISARLGETPWRLSYPLLCADAGHIIAAPVYFGTTLEGRWFYLDCAGGRREYFGGLEGLERKVRDRRCSQCGRIHWWRWYVVRRGEIAESQNWEPEPDETVEVLRRVLKA